MTARPAAPAELPLFQYWHHEEVPHYLADLSATFARHNPDLSHAVFSEASAEEFIAANYGPREVACFRALAVPAMQADYFRYCALHACGGIYADIDYECHGSLRTLLDGGRARLFHGTGAALNLDGVSVNLDGVSVTPVQNGLMVFPRPAHPLLEVVLAIATAHIERRLGDDMPDSGCDRRAHDLAWLPEWVLQAPGRTAMVVTGPGIFTGLYLAHELGSLEEYLRLTAEIGAERFAQTLCNAVGDDRRLAHAFEGVRLSPIAECEVVRKPGFKLPYKSSGAHWMRFRSNLYRQDG